MHIAIHKTVFFVIGIIISVGLFGQETGFRKKNHNLTDGIGIQGYDPVAYFKQHKAVKGIKENVIHYEGVTYFFATTENKEAFKKTPGIFEPEYGGWCAYAMGSKAAKVSVDPETFKIIDHKLYLFYNRFFTNTLKDWNKDERNLKSKADVNWQKMMHSEN